MSAGENRSIPYNMSTMPEKLKELGYKTHLVGKWHLGAGYRNVTPTARGFDSFFGYWNGYIGYYDYISENVPPNYKVSSLISDINVEYIY